MKKYVYNPPVEIPDYRRESVERIVEYCKLNLDTEISMRDAYQLWDDFSESWCAGWLIVDDDLLEDPLPRFMESHGYFVDL